MTKNEMLKKLLACAQAHGEQSEPDHEVGDLQDILTSAWAKLSPAQAKAVFNEHDALLDWE